MKENRKYPRYNCGKNRKFVAVYENTDRVIGEIKDFSRKGLRFISKDPLKEEAEIKIILQMSGIQPKVPTTIQIAWVKPQTGVCVYGARLVKISQAAKFDIMDLLYQDWKKQEARKS